MTKRYIGTDKNGTKYYQEDACPKCGGTGWIPFYHYVDGGRCFKCDGTGLFIHTIKEYTPEYLAKKAKEAERRAARKEAKEEARKQANLQKWRDEHPEEVAAYNKRQEELQASEYVGTIGERKEMEIEVSRVTNFETENRFDYYGGTIQKWVYILNDTAKNALVWITDHNPEYTGLKIGTTAKIKATIKAHDDSRGYKQTKLSRVTVMA